MTAILDRPVAGDLWGSMPGWGIVADLTPPELVAARRLKLLKKLIAVGLALVVVLCAGGYALAYVNHSSAAQALDAASARTAAFTAEQAKYARVTEILAATQSVNGQIATLMADDVDMADLLIKLRSVLPGTMSLASITATVNGAADGGVSSDNTNASLDTSGRAVIGSVTLTGAAQRIVDVSTYVSSLVSLPGVVNVVPTSNAAGAPGGVQWNITLQITDQLYTHRYTAAASAGGG
jgi:hypothetical protein